MNWLDSKIARMMCGGVLLCMGTLLGDWLSGSGEPTELTRFNETLVHASSASNGTSFSIATGAIDDDAEGVFVLDHETGELKCAVLNHRSGKFAALFSTNVTKEFGAAKNPEYQLVTGLVNFRRSVTPSVRRAMSVVYVLNSATGQMVAYGIPWHREAATTGRKQIGTLQTIDGMLVRD